MTDWFARPILNVRDVDASLRYYVDLLGFTSPWRYVEDGRARVAQVERQGSALILASNLAPDRTGKAVTFISLNVEPETIEGGIAALDALRAELASRGVAIRDGSWGYRLLVVEDPDGNQLLFNYPAQDVPDEADRGADGA
jgi:catechol 2,3-dioxygenase-like lactoylglutathione lyase family enzyme